MTSLPVLVPHTVQALWALVYTTEAQSTEPTAAGMCFESHAFSIGLQCGLLRVGAEVLNFGFKKLF